MTCILSAFITVNLAASDQADQADFFELSLGELANFDVTGAAVRSLNLNKRPHSNNPHRLNNQLISASVEVVDRKTIEARSLKNVVEVVESMVGVLSGESPSEPYSFSTRGFSRNSINVLYDGLSMGMSTLNMRPKNTFNVEQIEVAKGVSSLTAEEGGAGGAGGSVNIISKKPQLNQATAIDVLTSYGRYNTSSTNVGISSAVNEKSAYRIGVSRYSSDGWVNNTDSSTLETTASYLFAPSDSFNITASLNYEDDSLPAYWGTPLVPASVAQDADGSVVSTEDNRVIDKATRYVNYNVADSVIDSTSLWSRIDMNWTLSAATSMQATIYQFDADRQWQNAESYTYNTTSNDIRRDRLLIEHERQIQGLNLALNHGFGNENLKHDLVIKLESSENDFTRITGFDMNAADFYDIDSVDLYTPQAGVFGDVDQRQDKQIKTLNALVLEHRVSIEDAWFIDLGVRAEHISFDRQYIQFDGTIRQRQSLDTNINQMSYYLGLMHPISSQHNIYLNYAMKHDPIENDIKYFYDLSNFKPSDVNQWELGLKSVFNEDRTELTLAIYDIEKTVDYQSSDNAALKTNEQTSQGAEFAIKHELNAQFRIGGNLAYTDAKYGHYYDPEWGVDASNNRPVNVPESMLSAWLSYNTIFNLPIEMGLGYNRVDKRFANTENTTVLDEYQLFNVFVAYKADDYRLGFNVRNLTDEIYAPWSDTFYPDQVVLGSPRTYEISVRARF